MMRKHPTGSYNGSAAALLPALLSCKRLGTLFS
eukprot:CAMPEP_0202895902 /NCGR_PEP_ID=MMETSP1392-20130828/5010_1 /ASSEMBLY_ACC=CAM_ASM_000868 /TAXON_ID=225041 /ORGANISM="Chlamydomonas chlamydogama, Strain SAG 11-48b" /LENGTH=32 /DNA_ID= /DNA_START= /DNA_END= /DNA_ORIENTATION=